MVKKIMVFIIGLVRMRLMFVPIIMIIIMFIIVVVIILIVILIVK
jgi:hypothetical protein